MLDFQLQRSSTTAEFIARMVHACIAMAVLGYSIWAFTYVQSSYRLLFAGLMLLGLIPLHISLFGRRKSVFQTLFFGYWW